MHDKLTVNYKFLICIRTDFSLHSFENDHHLDYKVVRQESWYRVLLEGNNFNSDGAKM